MTNIPTVSGSLSMPQFIDDLNIVQQKFKRGEIASMLFEAYQVIGREHSNRLLALVQSTGTHAIFSFNVGRLPPQAMSDLAIDKIFPLNDNFELIAGRMDDQSSFQFSLKSFGEKSTDFFYYPLSSRNASNNFENFQKHVNKAKESYALRQQRQMAQRQIRPQTQAVDNGIVINPVEISFKWLNAYQKQEADMIAIDRGIADGTKSLKRRETKFQDELKKREKDYIIYKNYRIYCATWNINSQSCPSSDLSLWLARSDEPPDIYVIALQELDLSAISIGLSESKPDPIWNRKFMESLHGNAKYEQLTSVRLVGMMLTIFVREELRPSVVRCNIQSVGTGIISLGNKGGVAVSVTFNDANLCFVNSHLAAHMHEVAARNQGYDTINKKCAFSDISGRRLISEHDQIFWIGDLNYRINEIPGIRHDPNNYENLLKFDQLLMEMRKENVFKGYMEGDIQFRPTYKYDTGTDNYDSSEKFRAPAYCDRVLWKGEGIKQLSYNSVMEIRQSDHKPVYAEFTTAIKTKDLDLYKRVYEETLKRVDKYENDNQPQITVEKTEIDFDEVTFNELAIRDFTVANNCHLPVEFSFKQTDKNEKRICEKWLDVEPKSGRLLTGSSISIRIKFQANSTTIANFVQKINSSKKKEIFDILVLHVKDGHDVFISIIGLYRPSCFGLSVETLCQTNRPVCSYNIEELNELANMKGDTFKVSMPREFFLLIDYLCKTGTTTEGLFSLNRTYANSEKINQIRDWLDSWSNEEFPGNPHTAAEALLSLLESPKEPLLKPCADKLLRTNTVEEAMDLITCLTPPRRNMFLHLCLFLREGIGNKFYNVDEIATLYGDILLKKKSDEVQGIQDGRCRLLMLRFLHSDLGIFTRITNTLISDHEDV